MDDRLSKKYRGSIKYSSFVLFFLISILLHTLFYLFVFIDYKDNANNDNLVKIKIFDQPSQFRKKSFPEKKKTDKQLSDKKGQVVDISPPEKEEKPEKAEFLSKYDSKVIKETKADFNKNIKVRDRKLRQAVSPPKNLRSSENNELIIGDNTNGTEKKQLIKKGAVRGIEGNNGDFTKGKDKAVAGQIDGKAKKEVTGSTGVKTSLPKRFFPYMNGSEKHLSSPSDDYLPNVETGNETLLNTHKFIFADYYIRIKRAVSHYWNPRGALIIHDPRGNIYGRKDRYTLLNVTLNKKGTILDVSVKRTCGVDVLDKEAINAFKMAAPFPNPPNQLLEEDNSFTFTFGFIVLMNK